MAGLAGAYAAEELVGRMVIMVANLEPAVIRGVESQGMVLAVEQDGRLHLLTTDGDVDPGRPVA